MRLSMVRSYFVSKPSQMVLTAMARDGHAAVRSWHGTPLPQSCGAPPVGCSCMGLSPVRSSPKGNAQVSVKPRSYHSLSTFSPYTVSRACGAAH